MEAPSDFLLFQSSRKPQNPPKAQSNHHDTHDTLATIKQPLDQTSFPALGISPFLCSNLKAVGLNRPTKIQERVVSAIINNQEVVACAETGSGKTLSFIIPLIETINRDPIPYFAVILTPTRELALQIFEKIMLLARSTSLRVDVTVGGLGATDPVKEPHILVATPGRFIEQIKQRSTMKRPKFLILDEADQLLKPSSSFIKLEIPPILDFAGSSSCKWCLFSATGYDTMVEFFKRHRQSSTDNALFLHLNGAMLSPSRIKHFYALVPSQARETYLVNLLRTLNFKRLIIFTSKKSTCITVNSILTKLRFKSIPLHSALHQRVRSANLRNFTAGKATILVTTDLASRGIDIEDVDIVVHFDLPLNIEDYLHRSGRSARATKLGTSIAFFNELDVAIFRELRSLEGLEFIPYPLSVDMDPETVALLRTIAVIKRKVKMELLSKPSSSSLPSANKKV